ncbi:ODAD1 central coiled coil region domain-containing protein [Plasmodiophora brassicae]
MTNKQVVMGAAADDASLSDVRHMFRSLSSLARDRFSSFDQRNQCQQIRLLAEDNERLRHDMEFNVRVARDFKPSPSNKRLKTIIEQADAVNVALEQIKLAICEADLRIEEMQKLIQNTKQLSLVDELKRFAVIEGVLAKRQMHALTCINQTDTKVREMKLHSASAAKEVAFLQSVVEQLSQEQKAQRATITDTIKRSMAMFDGRSRSQAELHVARQVMMEHFEEFEQEWLDLCHVMDQERFQVAALKKYQQAFEERQARRLIVDSRASRIPKDAHRAGAIGNVLILRSEAHLRRKFARARWTRAALRCNIRDTEHRLRAMDARLRTICSAVGTDNIDTVIERMLEAEDTNYASFELMNELRQQRDALEDTVKLDDVEGGGGTEHERSVEAPRAIRTVRPVSDLVSAYEAMHTRVQHLDAEYNDLQYELDQLRDPVEGVLAGLPANRFRVPDDCDVISQLRCLEQCTYAMLDELYDTNQDEPEPVDLDAIGFVDDVQIDLPTTADEPLESVVRSDVGSDDDDARPATRYVRNVRSAPPIRQTR